MKKSEYYFRVIFTVVVYCMFFAAPLIADEPTDTLLYTAPEITVIGDKISTVVLDDEAKAASRLGITIREIPASVEVISQETMQTRGDRTVLEAVDKTAGFASASSPATPGVFSVRGFTGNGVAWLYDGIKLSGGSSISTRNMDIANLESIEILRGPASVLHGEGAIGAAINLVSRKPSFKDQPIEIDYGFSSFNSHRFHAGTGGSITDTEVAYRLDASTNRHGSNIDDERTVLDRITGSLLYKPSDNMLITLGVDYTHDETDNAYHGTPLIDGKINESLREINYNNLTGNIFASDAIWVRGNFEWTPATDWEITNRLYYYDAYREWRNVEKFTYDNGVVTRSWWGDLDHDHQVIGDRIDALYKGKIGDMGNKLLVGVDFSYTDFESQRNGFPGIDTVDAFDPTSVDFISVAGVNKSPARDATITQWSVFMEDQLAITPSLKLVGGLRYDVFNAEWIWLDRTGAPEKSKTHRFITWRLGAVYDLTSDLALYASYATAVEPGATLLLINPDQSQLDLTEGKQIEVGLKQSFWEGKGEWTFAVYDITKTNVFVPDPSFPSNKLAIGQQSSRGAELKLQLRPGSRWQINANIAAVHARYDDYTAGNPPVSLEGNTPPFAPEWVGNFGLRYMMNEYLGFDAWIRHVSPVYVDDANTVELDSYTTLDLSLDYRLSSWAKAGLNVRNVTDKLYVTYSSHYASDQVLIANPRTYELFVNLKI